MENKFDIAFNFLLVMLMVLSAAFVFVIYLITNGIRVNREVNIEYQGVEIVSYEQVYHVFSEQEIFVTVRNNTDKMIGTLKVKEENSEKVEKLNKLRPGKQTKLYFKLNSKFDDVSFKVEELTFVESE